MKILLVSQFFFPEPNSPRGLEFAKALQEKGHEVTCVTAFPSYPDGKIYNGYSQRLCQRENIEGVEVLRLPIYIDHSRSAILRFLSYLSFALSLLLILPFFIKGKFDILFSYCPPISVPAVSVILSWWFSSKLVVDIQDFWPDTLNSTAGLDKNSALFKVIGKFSYWTYRKAHHISVISPGMKSKLVNNGFDPLNVSVIYNWSTAREIPAFSTAAIGEFRKSLNWGNDDFVVLFAGNIGQGQALGHVLDAMETLRRTHPVIKFIFYGAGVDRSRLTKISRDKGLDNVSFEDRVSLAEINVIQQAADVLFLHLKEDPLYEITIPSKLAGYLMLGKPIIGGLQGDAKDLLDQSNAGFPYAPEDTLKLIACIREMKQISPRERADLGHNGRDFYQQKIGCKVGVDHFEQIFNLLIK